MKAGKLDLGVAGGGKIGGHTRRVASRRREQQRGHSVDRVAGIAALHRKRRHRLAVNEDTRGLRQAFARQAQVDAAGERQSVGRGGLQRAQRVVRLINRKECSVSAKLSMENKASIHAKSPSACN